MVQTLFTVVLGVAALASSAVAHGQEQRTTLIQERHIIVPSEKGCYCVDAISKSIQDDATNTKVAHFKECVESVGLPQQQQEVARNMDKMAAENGKKMAGMQKMCGKIVLDYSPGNITQECFEGANMGYKMHVALMRFIEETGDKKNDFVICLAEKANYLNSDRTGVNLDAMKEKVQKYFAQEAVEDALTHVQSCYDKFGTFQDGESVADGLEEFVGCIMEGCL